MSKVNPFTFVDSISFSKEKLEVTKEYVPFVINRHLSYFSDTVMYAAQMNLIPNADSLLQYRYLLGVVSGRKRFAKWYKRDEIENLKMVADHFNLNFRKAKEALAMLSPEQLEEIKNNKGGLNNEKRHL